MDELLKRIKETMATPMSIVPAESTEDRAKVLRQLWSMLIVLSIMIVVLFGGVVNIRITQSEVTQAVADGTNQTLANREAGFKNRALSCQVLTNLGTGVNTLPASCGESEVLKYYNPLQTPTAGSNSPAQVKNRALLCLILRNQGTEPPDCMDVNASVPGFT